MIEMEYFRMIMTGENKVWRKYFTFAERFLYNDNTEVDFYNSCNQYPILDEIKIQALKYGGDVVLSQSHFNKAKMPPFCTVRRLFLIREDILQEDLFAKSAGVKFVTIKVDGEFNSDYKLLSFANLQDCVDRDKSVRTQFDFTSKLVLAKSKIPQNVDGFFLTGWHQYGQYYSIVNEELKNALLQLKDAPTFLLFDKIDVSEI